MVGAVVRDVLAGKDQAVYARTIINAAGPFSDEVRQLSEVSLQGGGSFGGGGGARPDCRAGAAGVGKRPPALQHLRQNLAPSCLPAARRSATSPPLPSLIFLFTLTCSDPPTHSPRHFHAPPHPCPLLPCTCSPAAAAQCPQDDHA